MNEQRFDYTAYDDGTESIYDRKKDEYYFDMQLSKIEELMNELEDENERLRQEKQLLYENIDFLKRFIEKQGFKVKLDEKLFRVI